MPLTMSPAGRVMLEDFEGCSLTAFWDEDGWAIGCGLHSGDAPGLVVTEGMIATQAQVDAWLDYALAHTYGTPMQTWLGSAATTQNQFDAMLSLTYNIGIGGFHRSRVLYYHLEGDFSSAAQHFNDWIYAGGKINSDLVRRRAAESESYLNGVYPTGA